MLFSCLSPWYVNAFETLKGGVMGDKWTLTKHSFVSSSLVSLSWKKGSVGLWVWALESGVPEILYLSSSSLYSNSSFFVKSTLTTTPPIRRSLPPLFCSTFFFIPFLTCYMIVLYIMFVCLPYWNIVPKDRGHSLFLPLMHSNTWNSAGT